MSFFPEAFWLVETMQNQLSEVYFSIQNQLGTSLLKEVLVCIVVLLVVVWWWKSSKLNLPPGPVGLPFVGYSPFLGKEPYKVLHKLRQKYGNVFGLYLGRTYSVILGDYEAIKEAYSKAETTDKPDIVFSFIPDGLGFSSVNGHGWVEQRNYCMKTMKNLGLGKSNWEEQVQVEVEDFVRQVSIYNGGPFDVSRLLLASISNNISSLILGKRLPFNNKTVDFLNRTVKSFIEFAAPIGFRRLFPFLCDILANLGLTHYASNKRNIEEFNKFVKDEVRLHKSNNEENSEDFVEGYLEKIRENQEKNLGNTFNYTNLYGNIQALFIGASDTTMNSLNWLFITMATYLDIQSKVHEELDAVLGKEGKINWINRTSVPYTYAVIMEGQRWKTIAPIAQKLAVKDITIGGYHIPKGTVIIANIWGIHNDSKYWKEPEKFQPERFLSEDGKEVNLKPESYVPFSYGRRNCPAEVVAMMEILFYFVAIMQKFQILLPKGKSAQMEGILGVTYHAIPQEIHFVHR